MTHITGHLTNADGSLAVGEVVISWPPFSLYGMSIVGGMKEVTLVDGNLDLMLEPIGAGKPSSLYYTVRYELDTGAVYEEYWSVPDAAAVTLEQVRVSFPVAPGTAINPSQLTSSGAVAGMVLSWNGVSWTGGYVNVANIDPNFIRLNFDTAGTDFGIDGSPVHLGGIALFHFPSASPTARGLITTGAQTIGGDKTFANDVTITGSLTVTGASPFVPATRLVATGTGLTGGGDLQVDRTLSVVADSTVQRVRVSNGGVFIGARAELNLIQGSGSLLTIADNAGSNRIDVTIAATGGSGSSSSLNVPNTLVLRDSAGAFEAGSITSNGAFVVRPSTMTDLALGQELGSLRFQGYLSGATTTRRAGILAYAAEAWTVGTQSTYLSFEVTNSGGTVGEVMRLNRTGNLLIGTPSDNGVNKLQVAGSIKSLSGGYVFPDGTTQTTAATLTPWSGNIDASGYVLLNVSRVESYTGYTTNLRFGGGVWNFMAANLGGHQITSTLNQSFIVYTTTANGPAGGATSVVASLWVNTSDNSVNCAGDLVAASYGGSTLQSLSGTPPTANQIVRATSLGYIYASHINLTANDNGAAAITRVFATSDGFIRYYTLGNFSAQVTPSWSNVAGKPTIIYGAATLNNTRAVIYSNVVDSIFTAAAVEIRETNQIGTGSVGFVYAPRISFHWTTTAAAQIGIDATIAPGGTGTGVIRTFDNPGTGYAPFRCAALDVIGANLTVTGGSVIADASLLALNVAGFPGVACGEGLGSNQFCRMQWNTSLHQCEFAFSTATRFILTPAQIIMNLPTSSSGVPAGGLWRNGNAVNIV